MPTMSKSLSEFPQGRINAHLSANAYQNFPKEEWMPTYQQQQQQQQLLSIIILKRKNAPTTTKTKAAAFFSISQRNAHHQLQQEPGFQYFQRNAPQLFSFIFRRKHLRHHMNEWRKEGRKEWRNGYWDGHIRWWCEPDGRCISYVPVSVAIHSFIHSYGLLT